MPTARCLSHSSWPLPCSPVNFFAATTGNKQCRRCAAGTDTRGMRGQSQCQAKRPNLRRSRR